VVSDPKMLKNGQKPFISAQDQMKNINNLEKKNNLMDSSQSSRNMSQNFHQIEK
jgi:hypothetical protein